MAAYGANPMAVDIDFAGSPVTKALAVGSMHYLDSYDVLRNILVLPDFPWVSNADLRAR